MDLPVARLLERRLLLVTGKGGTGKTSIASALGVAAAQRGLEAVVIELGERPELPELLGDGVAPLAEADGRTPVRVRPGLHVFHVEPMASLLEYVELHFPLAALSTRLLRTPAMATLLDAAPGWRELIALGKLWHLESRRDADRPRYDILIVDAPASGHGLSLLSVPGVVLDTVGLGPLRRHTGWVRDLLRDHERTLVVPVTLAEELPVKETLELCAGVRDLGVGVGPIVVNGLEPPCELPPVQEVRSLLEAIPCEDAPVDPRALEQVVEHAVHRAELQQGFVARLRESGEGPLLRVPTLHQGVHGAAEIGHLADFLLAERGSS